VTLFEAENSKEASIMFSMGTILNWQILIIKADIALKLSERFTLYRLKWVITWKELNIPQSYYNEFELKYY
jgi:hypothetical protein